MYAAGGQKITIAEQLSYYGAAAGYSYDRLKCTLSGLNGASLGVCRLDRRIQNLVYKQLEVRSILNHW